MKLAFQKGERMPSGEVILREPETVKIFTNFKPSVQTTICPGSVSEDCSKSVTVDQMEPLSGLLRNLHSSIHVSCPNSFCQVELSVGEIQNHSRSCHRRGSYTHTTNLHGAKNYNVNLRVGEVFDIVDKMCEERKEDKIQVMFHKLLSDLKLSGNDLHKDVQDIFQKYIDKVNVSEMDVI